MAVGKGSMARASKAAATKKGDVNATVVANPDEKVVEAVAVEVKEEELKAEAKKAAPKKTTAKKTTTKKAASKKEETVAASAVQSAWKGEIEPFSFECPITFLAKRLPIVFFHQRLRCVT